MKLLKRIHDKIPHVPNWVTIILAVVLFLRIPSFFEPFNYGDEMIYLSLGEAVRRPDMVLYRDIHDNKPPLLYIFAAVAGNVFWFRVILAFWSFATVIIFWKLSEALFPKNIRLQKMATWIFAIFSTIPLLEGNIANSEVFMVGPTMLAFYLLLTKSLKPKMLLFSGVLFSIASLFKIPAAFDVPVIVVYWAIFAKKINFKTVGKITKQALILAIGFATPILISILWYWYHDAFSEYVIAAYLQNVGYLSSFRPDDVVEPFFVRNGPLLIRAAVVGLGSLLLYFSRKKLSRQFVFVSLWLLFSLFAAALSERPYPHYLIQVLPSVSILFAMLFSLKNIEQSLTIIPLTLAFYVPFYFNYWRYPVFPYYTRFLKFTTGTISKDQYFDGFDKAVNRNYKLTEFINNAVPNDDSLFVWGNSSSLYALTRRLPPIRFVADYHIKDFSSKDDVINKLEIVPPKIIVVLPDADSFTQLYELLTTRYLLINTIDGAEVWKLILSEIESK